MEFRASLNFEVITGYPAVTGRVTATQDLLMSLSPQGLASWSAKNWSGPPCLYSSLLASAVLVAGTAPLAVVIAVTLVSSRRVSRNVPAALAFLLLAPMPQAQEPWPVLGPLPKSGSGS